MKTRTGNDTYLLPVDTKGVVAATDGSNSVSLSTCVSIWVSNRERGGNPRGTLYPRCVRPNQEAGDDGDRRAASSVLNTASNK